MDPGKHNGMSLKDRRELVYEVSQWPQGASEILQCWTRRDLLELICAELGKERKYTNVPKSKMIAYLLKLVLRKNGQPKDDNANASILGQNNKDDTEKKENEEQPHHFSRSAKSDSSMCREAQAGSTAVCRNVACQATLNSGDAIEACFAAFAINMMRTKILAYGWFAALIHRTLAIHAAHHAT